MAEKYAYQSPYNFSENRVVDGVELEGLEFVDFKIAMYEGQKAMVKSLDNGASYSEARQVYRQTYNSNLPFGNIPDEVFVTILRYGTPVEDVFGVITGRDLEGNSYNRAEAGAWAAASFIPLSKLGKIGKAAKVITRNDEVFVKFGDNVSDAFKEAYAGGTHSGFLKNNIDRSIKELDNGIKSLEKKLDAHKGYLKDPSSKVEGFDNLRKGHQESLIKRWNIEVKNFSEQIDILNNLKDAK